MRSTQHISALIAISLIGTTAFAGTAPAMGNAPGGRTNPLAGAPQNAAAAGIVLAPGGQSTTTTGMGSGASGGNANPALNVPGVSGTSTPGRSPTGAAPNDQPGDDPAHRGLPATIGR